MECPRDKCTMTPQRQGKYPRFECPMCSGLLVAERELMPALGHAEDRRFEAVAKVKIANVKDSDIKCPQDGTPLKALKYLNTELDVCPKCHALWLDHGEYEKLYRRLGDEVQKMRPDRSRPDPRPTDVVIEASESLGVEDVLGLLRGVLRSARMWRRILR